MTKWLLRTVWRMYPRRYRTRFGGELERHLGEEREGRASFLLLADALLTLVRAWLDEIAWERVSPAGFGAGVAQTVRGLIRTPGYSLTVIAILALAIGANTAVFSATHAVLLRSLPYQNPEAVISVRPPPVVFRAGGWAVDPDFASLVASAALYVEGGSANLTREGAAERVSVVQVTPGFFQTLGVAPLLGRNLSDAPEDGAVAVLSHRRWARTFNANPSVVGKDIELNGRTYRVVGVMPADVDFPAGADLWLPFPLVDEFYGSAFGPSAIARMRPGLAIADLARILDDRLRAQYADVPAEYGPAPTARLRLLRDELTAPVRTPLFVLLGIAGLVTLLGCLNLAGVALARTAARADELGVRRALGARSVRIFSQLMGEVLILALVSGAASLLAAAWVQHLVVSVLPGSVPGLDRTGLHPAVLTFAAVVTVVAGLLVGAIPAFHGAVLGRATVSGSRTSTVGPRKARTQSALIVAQVALASVLVSGASLFSASLARLREVPLGYDLEHVLTFSVSLPSAVYPFGPPAEAYAAQLSAELRGIPGVSAVGRTTFLPLSSQMGTALRIRPPGTPEEDAVHVSWVQATASWLTAMGIPVLEGHPFPRAGSDANGLDHVVLNRALAHALFGDGPVAGRGLLVYGFDRKWHDAVLDAVVGNVYLRGATSETSNLLLTNLEGRPASSPGFAVRAVGDPAMLGERVREVVKSVDPSIAPYGLTTTAEAASEEIAARRALALLSTLFSVAALAVCALGLQGLVAQSVERRRRELGVRLALGATASTLVLRTALAPLRLVAVGLAVGLPVMWLLSGLLNGLLFEVAPRDPLVTTGVGLGLVGLALVAAWIPARRIVRVDPAEALRAE